MMNHRQRRASGAGAGLAGLMMVGVMVFSAIPAAAVDFAHPAFKRMWDRTDSLVASGQVSRTWFWGPAPGAAAQEQYVDAPSGTGTRLVQYFDKSRMEINDPNAPQNTPWFVTNGLLTIELISGQMQIGKNAVVNRFSANIPIAGDTDDANAPTYASFVSVSNTRKGDHPQADRTGQFATATINKAGQVGDDPAKAVVTGTKIVYFEAATKHNIPDIFWRFLNASGPISETGQIVQKRLIEPWMYASGFPISDAYWSRVKIKGEMQDVMIQAYERRVLTYVPTNVPGFQVEMGNIGLHYYDWRYKDSGKATGTVIAGSPAATSTPGSPVPTSTGTTPTTTRTPSATPNVITQGQIAFSSKRTGNYEVWIIAGDGTSPKNLTNNPADDDYPAYSPDGTKIVFATKRDGNWEIYVMNADGSAPTRLTNNPKEDTKPTWSPDGAKIVFVSDRDGNQFDVFVMNSNGTDPVNITLTPAEDSDPSWGAANRIVFASQRQAGGGVSQLYAVNPDGSGLAGPLTSDGSNFLPTWNTVGNRIAFVSTRNGGGNQEIYTMRPGGEEQTRITNNTYPDWDPAYAPDNSRIVYSSERITGNLELYTMKIDGTEQERITISSGEDHHPTWKVNR